MTCPLPPVEDLPSPIHDGKSVKSEQVEPSNIHCLALAKHVWDLCRCKLKKGLTIQFNVHYHGLVDAGGLNSV